MQWDSADPGHWTIARDNSILLLEYQDTLSELLLNTVPQGSPRYAKAGPVYPKAVPVYPKAVPILPRTYTCYPKDIYLLSQGYVPVIPRAGHISTFLPKTC